MTKILELVQNEKDRIAEELKECEKTLEGFPKGKIYTQTKGTKIYYYLKYRDGNRVVTRYVEESECESLRLRIMERDSLLTKIKDLKRELAVAERILSDPVIAKILTK